MVQVLSEVIAPVLSEPEEALVPDQALEAEQDVVGAPLVIDQLKVRAAP